MYLPLYVPGAACFSKLYTVALGVEVFLRDIPIRDLFLYKSISWLFRLVKSVSNVISLTEGSTAQISPGFH